jgi:hypothetical protein
MRGFPLRTTCLQKKTNIFNELFVVQRTMK